MKASLEKEYLTVAQAATLFQVSQSTVWRWINQGTIPAYRVGHRGIRLKRTDLAHLITPARKEPEIGGWPANPERDNLGPLSATEQKAGLTAIAKLKTLREEILQQRKGALFPSAAEDLYKIRAQRTRRLQ